MWFAWGRAVPPDRQKASEVAQRGGVLTDSVPQLRAILSSAGPCRAKDLVLDLSSSFLDSIGVGTIVTGGLHQVMEIAPRPRDSPDVIRYRIQVDHARPARPRRLTRARLMFSGGRSGL
jgi:hypothetical protein